MSGGVRRKSNNMFRMSDLATRLGIKNVKSNVNTIIARNEITISVEDIAEFIERNERKFEAGALAESTIQNIRLAIKKFVSYLLETQGDKDEYVINADILDDFFLTLAKKQYSKSTIEKCVVYTKMLFDRIAKKRGVTIDYEFKLRSIYGGKGLKWRANNYRSPVREKATPLDVQRAIDRVYHRYNSTEETKDRLITAILVLAYTGARGSEISRVKVQNIDFKNNFIEFYRDKLVTDKVTIFPLHPILASWLRYYIKKYNLKKSDSLVRMRNVDKMFKKYVQLKLRPVRAMNATFLVLAQNREYLLGHADERSYAITVNNYLLKEQKETYYDFIAPTVPDFVKETLTELKQSAIEKIQEMNYYSFEKMLQIDYFAHYPVIAYNIYRSEVWDIFEKYYTNLPFKPFSTISTMVTTNDAAQG
ncbi:site-specific integrase [Thermococcus sp. 21S9]|nr:site-specific integrase [Thermococcus sp. 21S9]